VSAERRVVAVVGHAAYEIAGVTQVELESGLARAGALRAALDADADVVAVDELADGETAALALEAALAGALVVAGIPAPDAEAARARLVGLGVEPFLLDHAVAGVLALRPVPPGRR
ncbi:MAG: hypothetical protein JWN32_2654, partial [Solirubrobacterales bacterium]|nr:hypothetical protein [Solirubrobacterales bacterium]